MAIPCFSFVTDGTGEEVIIDIAEHIEELNIVHNDIDADGSGRDVKTGKMKRKRIAQKHTLNVKLLKIDEPTARTIFHQLEYSQDFYVKYLHPCLKTYMTKNFYCSSVNFGAQQYNRYEEKTYYIGATFNIIEM